MMEPVSRFAGRDLGFSADRGLNYLCANCGSRTKIWDRGALFMGSIYSLFWSAVGVWAFLQGPYWYLRHISYFGGDYQLSFLVLDVGIILLSLATLAFSGWVLWTCLFSRLHVLVQYPVTSESRRKTREERVAEGEILRGALLSIFVYPILLWIPLLGLFWVFDAVGFDIQGNDFAKYAGIAIVLGLAVSLANRYGVSMVYSFVGMVLWLAIFVTVIFLF
jgi:hypothetical protein